MPGQATLLLIWSVYSFASVDVAERSPLKRRALARVRCLLRCQLLLDPPPDSRGTRSLKARGRCTYRFDGESPATIRAVGDGSERK
jgi:hypothetical protein